MEDEDDEEEEEEPKLKYHRLGSTVHYSVTEVLKKDSASSMTVHEKFLVSENSFLRYFQG